MFLYLNINQLIMVELGKIYLSARKGRRWPRTWSLNWSMKLEANIFWGFLSLQNIHTSTYIYEIVTLFKRKVLSQCAIIQYIDWSVHGKVKLGQPKRKNLSRRDLIVGNYLNKSWSNWIGVKAFPKLIFQILMLCWTRALQRW